MRDETSISQEELLLRWRLILGDSGEEKGLNLSDLIQSIPISELAAYSNAMERINSPFGQTDNNPDKNRTEQHLIEIDKLLQFCYDRPSDKGQSAYNSQGSLKKRRTSKRRGGKEKSRLTVPIWLSKVKELFPREICEVLEADLVKRKGIQELVDSPELLDRVEPSMEMVKLLLTYSNFLTPEGKKYAKRLIKRVVEQLKDQLRSEVVTNINGALRRDKYTPHKAFKNLDLNKTLRRNLKNYDQVFEKVIVDQMFFHTREKRRKPWHIITVVDQSGSMLDSVIYSAVLASIFWELPKVKSSLIVFDTSVVDLSSDVKDPVEVLMSVQLGGGTNIGKAMAYAQQIITEPAKTIVVLITDFYEGCSENILLTITKNMIESRTKIIGLAALGSDTYPSYDKYLAQRMRQLGVDVLATTPQNLSYLISRIIAS